MANRSTDIYHVTPITPDRLLEMLEGRNFCVSFYHPQQIHLMPRLAGKLMLDNGAYSEWQAAMNGGEEWFVREDWTPYYRWLEEHLFIQPDTWCVIPDAPGAPTQINDSLIGEFPFKDRGVPLWHMDGPVERLGRLLERFDKVAFGWVGQFDPALNAIRKDQREVGCDAYFRVMERVQGFFGNTWPNIHMMRGIAVHDLFEWDSVDASSLGKNHHRYKSPLFAGTDDELRGQLAYADLLEGKSHNDERSFRPTSRRAAAHRSAIRLRAAPQRSGDLGDRRSHCEPSLPGLFFDQ